MKTLKYGSIQLAPPQIGSAWDQEITDDFLGTIARSGSNVEVGLAKLGIPFTVTSQYKVWVTTNDYVIAFYTTSGDILMEFKGEQMLMDINGAIDWFQSSPCSTSFYPVLTHML